MKEPWETLLGHLRGHWMLNDYLHCEVPNVKAIQLDERWWSLSSGEQALVMVTASLLRINECWLAVDDESRRRIEAAVRIAVDA